MIEKTLVVLKPDAVERKLVGSVVKYYEESGLSIEDAKMCKVSEELVRRHYPDSMAESLGKKSAKAGEKIDNYVEQGMKVLNWNRTYMTRGSVFAMILVGENAIKQVRAITGYTDPSVAESGTIRGDLGIDSILQANNEQRAAENLVHASGSVEEAEHEIDLWFT